MPPIQREVPKENQESVWDYPRPPRVELTDKRIVIVFNGVTIADTTNAFRVLETSHPPVYYLPQSDLAMQYLSRVPHHHTVCEFKGSADYWTLRVGDKTAEKVGWSYPDPTPAFIPMRDYIAFHAGPMDLCTVDGERVQPQPGGFYGGWITSDVVGPFKGGPGSWGW